MSQEAALVRDRTGPIESRYAEVAYERPHEPVRELIRGVLPGRRLDWFGKRAMDIVGALMLLAVFSPVILVVTAWLWRDGNGVLFRHRRVGQGGRPFTCYKFVTMVKDADRALAELLKSRSDLRAEWSLEHKLKDDPRITRIGTFLRKTSLDELPQLWNVLKGEMSLVGPRPIVYQEIWKYSTSIRHYLGLKPGLTGLWQVSGRNDVGYRRRVILDRAYAMRSSFALDSWILLQTVPVVLLQRGAY